MAEGFIWVSFQDFVYMTVGGILYQLSDYHLQKGGGPQNYLNNLRINKYFLYSWCVPEFHRGYEIVFLSRDFCYVQFVLQCRTWISPVVVQNLR